MDKYSPKEGQVQSQDMLKVTFEAHRHRRRHGRPARCHPGARIHRSDLVDLPANVTPLNPGGSKPHHQNVLVPKIEETTSNGWQAGGRFKVFPQLELLLRR